MKKWASYSSETAARKIFYSLVLAFLNLAFFLLSVLISFLPAKAKSARLQPYSTVAAHVVSGILETFVALVWLLRDYLVFLSGFNNIVTQRILNSTASYTEGQMHGVGLAGFFAYLFRPWTWILVYHLIEGCVRSIEAAVNDVTLGTASFHFIFQIMQLFNATFQSSRRRLAIGPHVMDQVQLIDDGASLKIESVDAKPWWEHQVLKYREILYQMSSHTFEKTGSYYRHHYHFQKLSPGQIIRGVIIEYTPTAERQE